MRYRAYSYIDGVLQFMQGTQSFSVNEIRRYVSFVVGEGAELNLRNTSNTTSKTSTNERAITETDEEPNTYTISHARCVERATHRRDGTLQPQDRYRRQYRRVCV